MRVLEECAVDGVDSGKLASSVISPWSDALPLLLLLLLLTDGLKRRGPPTKTVHILFLANDRCLRDYDLAVARC